ncbi:uncharacterized protein LOC109282731 [Alligator mississippiensis]|uniref:uncharacterized protein LOC109282731 n=1 Tax=Alligator mississippiensis TaxID=8496 RepID=UPI00090764DE|nr:uncharacterized protein LOC109282731 [Alligator mississippiensis]
MSRWQKACRRESWCKIKSLRSALYKAKDANSCSGAGCTIARFYDKLPIALSKDVGNTLDLEAFSTRVGLEEEEAAAAAVAGPPESETISMSRLYGDCSLLHDDHEWQEAPSVTLHLVPLSPSGPRGSTNDEAEEVEGQEETHAADASCTVPETQEHAGPFTMTHSHWERRPARTSAEHCKQRRSCEPSLKALAESLVARACEAAWWDELRESQHKEVAILEEGRDTMQNLKDVVEESRAELEVTGHFQGYLSECAELPE